MPLHPMHKSNGSAIVSRKLAVFAVLGVFASMADAQSFNLNLTSPSFDRWNYPFASSPGGNPYSAVFSPLTASGFDPQFDNRDGQMVAAFNTAAAGVAPGLGARRYLVTSAAVLLTVETGNSFQYDPTPDSYRTWLGAGDPFFEADGDPGHAVELFGTRFRNGFTLATYTENVAYSPAGPFGKFVRSGYPVTVMAGRCRDVSNNVDERFDPVPFAVGTNPALTPGQNVPVDTVLRFQIDVANPDIHRWLRRALDEGQIDFSVASVFPSQQQTVGGYPRFYTRENLSVLLGLVSAARLELAGQVLSADAAPRLGDLDLNGSVNVADLLGVISAWGPCPCCAADVNFDDVVNVTDLLTVISNWG